MKKSILGMIALSAVLLVGCGSQDEQIKEGLKETDSKMTQVETDERILSEDILGESEEKAVVSIFTAWEAEQLWNIEADVLERMKRVDWDKQKERTYDPQNFCLDGIQCIGDFPERNVRVYAYNDEEIQGRGITVVTDRDIYYYDWCYTDEREICPDVFWNDMKNQLQFACHIYSEADRRADALHILQKNFRQELVEYTLTADDYSALISDEVTWKHDVKEGALLLEDNTGKQYVMNSDIQGQVKGIDCTGLSCFSLGYRPYLWCDVGYVTDEDTQINYDKMPRLMFEVVCSNTGNEAFELKLIDVIEQGAVTALKVQEANMWEAYAQIAQEYYDGQQAIFEDAVFEEGYLNGLYFVPKGSYLADETKQTFLVHDLNGDGTEEFFIARSGNDMDESTIYDVFTWKDKRLYRLMSDIGYRNGTCDIQEGGYVLSRYSGTAYDFGVDVLILPENGIEMEYVDGVFARQKQINESYTSEYFRAKAPMHKRDAEKITREKYDEFLAQYQPAELTFIENTPETVELLKFGKLGNRNNNTR